MSNAFVFTRIVPIVIHRLIFFSLITRSQIAIDSLLQYLCISSVGPSFVIGELAARLAEHPESKSKEEAKKIMNFSLIISVLF